MDNIELLLGILSALFLIIVIFISILAIKKLPTGILKSYIQIFIYSSILLTLSFIWHTTREFFNFKEQFGAIIEYPEYIFEILVSILLTFASYRLYEFSKVFEVNDKTKSIHKK